MVIGSTKCQKGTHMADKVWFHQVTSYSRVPPLLAKGKVKRGGRVDVLLQELGGTEKSLTRVKNGWCAMVWGIFPQVELWM